MDEEAARRGAECRMLETTPETKLDGLRRVGSRLPETAEVCPLIRHLWQGVVNERYRH